MYLDNWEPSLEDKVKLDAIKIDEGGDLSSFSLVGKAIDPKQVKPINEEEQAEPAPANLEETMTKTLAEVDAKNEKSRQEPNLAP